ncbi:hypothetical protein JAO29_12010 [Edaphobacter sp. HDX4]|uniref:hypothetical protein n=1 Tax=Edaphobacter sp. HDX4 TaxID=2794064 RepID=UPI002FE6645E
MSWVELDTVAITETIMFLKPKLELLAIAVLLTVATTILIRRNRLSSGWAHKVAFGLGLCLAVPTALSILIAGCSLIYMDKPHVFVSPDRKHVADLTYEAGFLGRDSTVVSIRSSNNMHSEEAYLYFGPSSWEDTTIRWLDNKSLEIGYYPDSGGRRQECNNAAAGVHIYCKLLIPRQP